jgi:hypothetical protein
MCPSKILLEAEEVVHSIVASAVSALLSSLVSAMIATFVATLVSVVVAAVIATFVSAVVAAALAIVIHGLAAGPALTVFMCVPPPITSALPGPTLLLTLSISGRGGVRQNTIGGEHDNGRDESKVEFHG